MNCPNCTADNPEEAKFCHNCGFSLAPTERPPQPPVSVPPTPRHAAAQPQHPTASPHTTGERRVVTALFADVVGSTALAEQLDPEDWTEIMNRAFDWMAPAISRFGGVITRLMGDALLAFFGAPLAHEDDPLRAAHASLALLETVREYSTEVRRLYGIDFAIRIGLNTGPVVVGEVGSAQVHEYTAMGDAVNLAARMQSAARPMSAWITENTYRQIASDFEVTDLGLLPIKGKAEPVHVYELLGLKTQAGGRRGSASMQSPLVGRQAELAILLSAARAAAGSSEAPGVGRGVLLVGEAGIGKSRLILEWKSTASQDLDLASLKWATGSCLSYSQTQAYQLIASLLYSLLELPEVAQRSQIGVALEQKLHDIFSPADAHTVLYLRHLLAVEPTDGKALEQINIHDPQELQMQYLAALRHLVRSLTQRQPLVLILEDIQWADPSSIELLVRLVPLALELPLLFCCLSRPEPDAPGWKLFEAINQHLAAPVADGRLAHITLASLKEADAAQMVSNLIAAEILPADMRAILEKSEGNPLFVEELIRWVQAATPIERRVNGGDGATGSMQSSLFTAGLPDTLQALLLARIDRLPPAARHILRVAAVIGRRFLVDLLRQVLGNSRLPADITEELTPTLAQLVAAGFVEIVPGSSGMEFQFHHALVQQAAYLTLLKADQRQLHQSAGQAMEELYPDQIEANASILAYHFGRARNRERGIHYYMMAADAAVRRYALAEALSHYTSALEIYEQGTSGVRDEGAALHLRRGAVYEKLGEFEPGRRDLETALQAARAAQDTPREMEALLALGMLWAARDYKQTGGYYQQALHLARQAGSPSVLAASLNRVGNWYANLDQPAEGIPFHQEALTIYQELQDAHGIADTLDLLGMTSGLGGDMLNSVEYFTQAIARYRQLDDRHGLSSSLTSLGMRGSYFEGNTIVTPINRLTDASAEVEEALEITRSIQWQSGQAYALLILSQIVAGAGDYSLGIEYGMAAQQIAAEIEHIQWMSGINTVLGMIYADLLIYNTARRHLEQALAQARESGSLNWTIMAAGSLASVMIAEVQPEQAADLLKTVLQEITPARTVGQRIAWCARVELALARNDWQDALAIIDRLLSDSQTLDHGRAGVRVTYLHGQALALSGDYRRAEQELNALLSKATALDSPGMLWRANASLAHVYAAQGDHRRADDADSQARTFIDRIANNLADNQLREIYVRGALDWLRTGKT